MSGEKKKMIAAPQTVAELEAACPDLAAELRDQGAKSVDTTAAGAAERERVMGLVTVHFGAEAAGKFAEVVETGVTEAQYKAIVGDTAPGAAQAQVVEGKEEILGALAQSGAENPGADNTGTESAGGKDFNALVEEYKALHKCSKLDAMAAVMKKHPKAHAAYLKSVN